MKAEVRIAEMLNSSEGHRHIIKFIGTSEGSSTGGFSLHILTFAVTVCNVDQFLDDCKHLYDPTALSLHDLCEIRNRFTALGIPGNRRINSLNEWPNGLIHRRRLHIMGFITCAILFMHNVGVEHRNLKPQNILLGPDQVYITDFGTSRARSAATRTTSELASGHTRDYAAPEVTNQDAVNPKQEDVHSLRCIFLHFWCVMRGTEGGGPIRTRAECSRLLMDQERSTKDIEEFLGLWRKVKGIPIRVQDNSSTGTVRILIKVMLSDERTLRSKMKKVQGRLRKFGIGFDYDTGKFIPKHFCERFSRELGSF